MGARAVHADCVQQERSYLRTWHTLAFQIGGKLQHGGAERAWLRAEVKGEDLGARKTVVVAPSMRKRDQLVRRAPGNSVPGQQPQKLVILGVSVSDSTRHEKSADREGRKKSMDIHG